MARLNPLTTPHAVMWAEQFTVTDTTDCRVIGMSWKCCSLGRDYNAFLATIIRQVAEGVTAKAVLELTNGQRIIVRRKEII
jgi:hypothetical protein